MIFDVLIIGGGLVGASLAAALKRSGLSVALVEAQPMVLDRDGWDSRIYAISPGSAAFLRNVAHGSGWTCPACRKSSRCACSATRARSWIFPAYQLGAPGTGLHPGKPLDAASAVAGAATAG